MNPIALWHTSGQTSQILPGGLEWTGGDLMLKTRYSLVSLGTELLVARGAVPLELWEDMRVPYMEGNFALPVKYGYSLVAQVVEGPEEWVGKWVHVMHPHQNWCRVDHNDCTVIPEGIPPRRATLASNLETALTAVWDSGVSAGDRVLVVGFGLVGALTAMLLRQFPGVEIDVAEINPLRKAKAAALGFGAFDTYHSLRGYDVTFHATATGQGLQTAIDFAGPEARIMELSWYGEHPVNVHLGAGFHSQRKQILSTQVGVIPHFKLPRWNKARRKEAVMRLLSWEGYDALFDHTVSFEELPGVFERLRAGEYQDLTCLVDYPD
ncbi:MAG: zinc-binding alcohol dehydrogenase [Haliscomenobacter sp.]|nr:zinc-binding alcohol dehydrogenase [Haliscomenobacter sp.]MBK7476287.1 zinc-binding alcohol dehydrogenase [Haliscomenobacter sp.]MBK8879152.1 zinc-binding alcohol dehydrogenase [Haliscomenobacter sp.]